MTTTKLPSSAVRVVVLLAALVGLGGCEGPAGGAPAGGAGGGTGSVVAFLCDAPAQGCACEVGTAPVSCYVGPEIGPGGALLCGAGTRMCRGGVWSTCENIASYSLAANKDLGTSSRCSACNPGCFEQTTTPDDDDLTDENCDDVYYDPSAPGITVETSVPTETVLPDTDGDGMPDVADDCPTNPSAIRAPCNDTSIYTQGYGYVLRPGEIAEDEYPELELQLDTVDYYVLMDTTGSMSEEITNLQEGLTTGNFNAMGSGCSGTSHPGVLGAILCELPDTVFGVGMVREYPRDAIYSGENDVPYIHLLDMTEDLDLAQDAVNSMSTEFSHYTGSGTSLDRWLPEATSQALYSVGTGLGLGPWVPTRGTCASGGVGYPCFRPNSIPIVLVITDAPMQNGPSTTYQYSGLSSTAYVTPDGNDVPASRLDQPPVTTVDIFGCTLYERMTSDCPAGNNGNAGDFDLGDLTNASVTVMGTTSDSPLTSNPPTTLSADEDNADQCSGTGRRAPYLRFTLSQPSDIVIDTNGSEFDTRLALLGVDRNVLGTTTTETTTGSERYCCRYRANGSCRDYCYRDVTITQTVAAYYCNDDRASANAMVDPDGDPIYPDSSYLSYTLPAGTYYVSLDGAGSGTDGRGAFQVRIRNASAAGTLVTSASTPRTWASSYDALQDLGAKTIGIAVCDGNDAVDYVKRMCNDTVSDLEELGRRTGSVDSGGAPFVYRTRHDGTGLSSTIVEATLALANYLRLDVSLACVDNPSTAADECALFDVRGNPSGNRCPDTCATTPVGGACNDCAPGTTLNFGLEVENVGVAQTDVAQIFEFHVALVADGLSELSRVPVRVVVPPITPTMPNDGWFEMIYASGDNCQVPQQRADWGELAYTVDIPDGASIEIELRTAQTLEGLEDAEVVAVDAVDGTSSIDIGAELEAGGAPNRQLYLAVRFHLATNDVGDVAPALQTFDMVYTCEDFE